MRPWETTDTTGTGAKKEDGSEKMHAQDLDRKRILHDKLKKAKDAAKHDQQNDEQRESNRLGQFPKAIDKATKELSRDLQIFKEKRERGRERGNRQIAKCAN